MSTHSKIKAVLVGAGGWGLQHARILSQRPDIDFRALAGRTPDKTQKRAAQFGVRAYTNITEMIGKEKPDLVFMSLPNDGHFQPTLEVIRAGVPLFVEKPLVFDLKEADTLIKAAAKRKLFFGINFNHHYARPVAMAHRAIQQGRLGDLIFATWRFGGEGGTSHPFNNLLETQCHAFDMLEFLCGPIDSVMAQMTDKTHKGTYRTLVLALHFANGAVGSLVGSYDSSYAYPDTHRVEINGTKGRILIEDTVRRYTFNAAGSETAEVWQSGYFNDRDRDFYLTFDRHMDAVLAAFKAGKQPPVHARAGHRALQLAYAAIKSYSSGKRVPVPADSFVAAAKPEILPPPPNP
ncbi:MAG TPA: Gfo/Idh/MocA family oxidoreductase [Verrucomicrobiae bacterium]|jgi:predicted dehydrogenase